MKTQNLLPFVISVLDKTPYNETDYEDLVSKIRSELRSRKIKYYNLNDNVKKALDLGQCYGLVYQKGDVIRSSFRLTTSSNRNSGIDNAIITSKKSAQQPMNKNTHKDDDENNNSLISKLCNWYRQGRRSKRRGSRGRKRSGSRQRQRTRSRSRSRSRSRGRRRSRSRRR